MKEGEIQKGKEIVPKKHFVRFKREIFIDILTKLVYRPEISKESKNNIKETKNDLRQNPNRNVIIIFNHLAYGDPLLAGYIGNKIDPEKKDILLHQFLNIILKK